MAVHAQYPSNVLLLNRAEAERNKEMEPNFLQQSPVFLSANGGIELYLFSIFFLDGFWSRKEESFAGNVNPRKRGRDVAQSQQQINMFSMQDASFTPAIVSTGLRLTFKDQNQREEIDSIFSDDLAAEINRQRNEIEQFVLSQVEQLRRGMAERRQKQCRTLFEAVNRALGKKLREKEAGLELARRRGAELQDRLAGLRSESMAWQAKAMAEQTAAASLHAQLQQAAAAGSAPVGESEWPADDAASAYVDPDRSDKPKRLCWFCHTRPASVVLLPCRHLCVCPACDSVGAASNGCPACGCFRTGSLQVFFS